jgi:hypothetical protein
MKPFTKIAAALFGLVGLVHIIRLFYPFRVEIAGNSIPPMASIGLLAIAFVLCIGLWKESKK